MKNNNFWSAAALMALLILLLTAFTPATFNSTEDQPTFFKRSALVISDIDRALTLYRDVLGFTVNSQTVSKKNSYSYEVFNIPKEAHVRFATLDSPTQERTLAFIEVKGVERTPSSGIIVSAPVIRVKDLAETMKKVKALGLEALPPRTVDNGKLIYSEQAFTDFDNHRVVLYELLPRP